MGRLILVFASMLMAGALSTSFLQRVGGRELWIVPAGIAVAAVVRWGPRQAWAVFAANLLFEWLGGRPLLPSMLAAAGLAAGALVTADLLRREGFDAGFARRRDAPLFCVASLLGMALAAAVGMLALSGYYPVDPQDHHSWAAVDWVRWWLNDATGALLFGPLLVPLQRTSFAALARAPRTAACLGLAMLLTALWVVFAPSTLGPPGVAQLPVAVLSLALVVVASLRFGLVPTAAVALGLVLIEALSYSFGLGVFRDLAPVQGLIVLWSFIGAVIAMSLLLAVLVGEQRRVEALAAGEARRNQLFLRNAGDGVCILDASGRAVEVSDSFCVLTGYARDELLGMEQSRWHPQAALDTRVAGEQAALDAELAPETRYRRKDGTLVEVAVRCHEFTADGRRYRHVSARDLSDIRRLEGALLDAIGREQRRLGQDIHDGLGQELTVIAMWVASLASVTEPAASRQILAQLGELTQRAIRNCRGIAHGLSPVGENGGDLASALRELGAARAGPAARIDCEVNEEQPLRLSARTADHLYRIAQEAVANALKHSGAARIAVRLAVGADTVRLEIEDDGVGLRHPARVAGIGLSGMAYRARAIGGELTIGAVAGGGTRISCLCANGAPAHQAARRA